ncbi:MFS transporter [Celerinatantimonas diazotrophica]|uniref:PPP family 3-phenylpropionic acid transporter n=1 Tax=Celerinatantimonas diazotrophica TaxID=412034 RepID=A0A4R1KAN5_9GAMM|nr:MFS transporter [Celerinatantimonas diazotrophica]TCK61464.1 PPP family 3-phenylpropionic acid transporter [Celerinatantimonas diazotrophica]CAG9296927.1 putative 3-phenylpropionic acid transporter [Celerinatantimonas diazotrophica]
MLLKNIKWLGGCYFAYFGVLGVIVPYLSVFLSGRGFDSATIGTIMAITLAMRVISPGLWSAIAQKSGRRVQMIRIGALLTIATLVCLSFDLAYWVMLALLAGYNLFWNGLQAQIETLTLNSLATQAARYPAIRAWGSIGFIIVTMITGVLVHQFGSETIEWIAAVSVSCLILFTIPVVQPQVQMVQTPDRRHTNLQALFKPAMILFWLAILCLQMSHGPYYTFFVLYLRQGGYSTTFASAMVSLGVLVEISMFMVAGRLFIRFSAHRVLLWALGLTVVRWLLLGYCRDILPLLVLEQALHAASFALAHAASMQLLSRQYTQAQQSSAQALYASCGFGLGGALGAFFSGLFWHDGSGAQLTMTIAAALAFLGFILVALMPKEMFEKDIANA